MDTTRQQLDRLIDRDEIAPADYPRAATLLGLYPSLSRWRAFLDHLLLWLSALALGFSLLFFIAYNWTAMDRIGQFVLVELALVIALGVIYGAVGAAPWRRPCSSPPRFWWGACWRCSGRPIRPVPTPGSCSSPGA